MQDIMDGVTDMNCLSKSQVVGLAHNLKINRALSARRFLLSINCKKLAENIEIAPAEPGKGWISCFCERNNLKMTWRENLEEIRLVSIVLEEGLHIGSLCIVTS